MSKAKVAVLRTSPNTVLEDHERLLDLAEARNFLDPGATTILKDNISWHFPFPSANTTPWQLEGTIRGLRGLGYRDISCVQNKTVVTNAFKGEDLNRYVPIFQHYDIPVLYNFREEDIGWVPYQPKGHMLALNQIYPEGIRMPDYFFGKNIVHLPTAKCVAGDTEVTLADGTVQTIRDLVAEQMERAPHTIVDSDGSSRAQAKVALMAMDESGRVRSASAVWFCRSVAGDRKVFKVRTRTGRTLTATADHLVHTPRGWTAIGELRIGDRIAAARRVRVVGAAQALPVRASRKAVRVTARAGRKYDADFCQQVIDEYVEGGSVTAMADHRGVRWQVLQSILKRHDVPLRGRLKDLRTPAQTSPVFWRWMGYIFAEGCVERGKTCDKLWWSNTTDVLRADYVRLTWDLFGLRAKSHVNSPTVYTYSRELARFLEDLGLPIPLNSENKRVPDLLHRCTDEEIAAFLSGYLDGDGTVSNKQLELSATTKSARLARDLQDLFARLGAVAFRHEVYNAASPNGVRRKYHRVFVSGEDLARLSARLQLLHPEKQRKLVSQVARWRASKRPGNWDTVPMPPDGLQAVRKGLGLTQAATKMASSVNKAENGPGNLTPRVARKLIGILAAHDREDNFAEDLDRLRALASDDLAWDYLVELEEVPGDDVDLYDVTVPATSSFIGNGLVLHNCHIYTTTTGAMKNAFGGLLNHHRHYTHSWIHETLVDLLTIQKEIHTGLFAVMDGTTAGNGAGPRIMKPETKNVVLASGDQVAIDAVAAAMMGFDPMSLPFIRLAHERGLGVGDPREIEVVGDPEAADERWGFQVGMTLHRALGWLSWYGPTKVFQKLLFRTPLVNIPIVYSEVYHDYYRWNVKEKGIFDRWKRESPWGRLFARYETEGTLGDTSDQAAE